MSVLWDSRPIDDDNQGRHSGPGRHAEALSGGQKIRNAAGNLSSIFSLCQCSDVTCRQFWKHRLQGRIASFSVHDAGKLLASGNGDAQNWRKVDTFGSLRGLGRAVPYFIPRRFSHHGTRLERTHVQWVPG